MNVFFEIKVISCTVFLSFKNESAWSGLDPFKTAGKAFSIGWPFLVVFCWSLNLQPCQNPKKATNQSYWPWSISQPFKVLSSISLMSKEGTVELPWNGKVSHCKHTRCLLYVVHREPKPVFLHRNAAAPLKFSWDQAVCPAGNKQSVQQSRGSEVTLPGGLPHTQTEWAVPWLEFWGSSIP